MRRFLAVILVFAVCSLLSPRTVHAQELARLVPQDAVIYVEVSDPSKIVERLLAPDILGVLESVDQFRQFTQSDQFARLHAFVAYMETKLGANWRDAISDLSSGGVVLAIGPGSPNYVLLVVRSKKPDMLARAHEVLIEAAEKEAKDKGNESPVKSKEYKGATAWSLGKDEFHSIIGDTLVVTNKQESLKTVLDRNAGEGPSPIAESADWREARDRALPGHIGWAFARLEVLRQAGFGKDLYQERAANAGIPIFFGGLSHVLGRAPYVAASLVLNEQRLALRFEAPRDGSSWPEQYRGFYAAKPGEEAAVPLRPARTIASLSFYRDIKSMWDAREKLVAAEALPGFTELESNVGPVLFGGREFSNEVLGEFGPRFRLIAAAQDFSQSKFTPDIKLPAAAFVCELNNPREFGPELLIAFQSVLGLANIGLGQQGQPRFILSNETYKGFEIQGARFLDRAAGTSGEAGVHLRHNFSPACTIAGRYFVLGSTTQIVRDCIDALGDCNVMPRTTGSNIIFEISLEQAAKVLAQNKEPLVSQNMVANGNTRERAEQEFQTLVRVLGLFGNGAITWTSEPLSMHVDLEVEFGKSARK